MDPTAKTGDGAGTGKSHLLIGLGQAAVAARYRGRYLAAADLVESSYRSVADNSHTATTVTVPTRPGRRLLAEASAWPLVRVARIPVRRPKGEEEGKADCARGLW